MNLRWIVTHREHEDGEHNAHMKETFFNIKLISYLYQFQMRECFTPIYRQLLYFFIF